MSAGFCLALHGGAGVIKPSADGDLEEPYKTALRVALQAGYDILASAGSSIDAAEAAVVSLENCPLFNAGKGSVFNAEGKHEMEASIMNGKDLACGAVTGLTSVKNPIRLARAVMEKSDHVFLSGRGATAFAELQGLPLESQDYFFDQMRFEQFRRAKEKDVAVLDHSDFTESASSKKPRLDTPSDQKFGTVGAVALDQHGNLCAATSTGGLTNKKFGRIGDSPVIGSGTYANNKTCAVSCTGKGEFFIRAVAAYDISCLMEYRHQSLSDACDTVVMDKLVKLGGMGGVVAVDAEGNIAMPFNTPGMYRAYKKSDGSEIVKIFKA